MNPLRIAIMTALGRFLDNPFRGRFGAELALESVAEAMDNATTEQVQDCIDLLTGMPRA